MKNYILIAALTLLLTSCSVGTYSVQSGTEDVAYITFTDDVRQMIYVTVDDAAYSMKTVKQKAYKSGRNIRQTALNTIRILPGQHNVTVSIGGSQVYSHKIFLSTGETKIIEL